MRVGRESRILIFVDDAGDDRDAQRALFVGRGTADRSPERAFLAFADTNVRNSRGCRGASGEPPKRKTSAIYAGDLLPDGARGEGGVRIRVAPDDAPADGRSALWPILADPGIEQEVRASLESVPGYRTLSRSAKYAAYRRIEWASEEKRVGNGGLGLEGRRERGDREDVVVFGQSWAGIFNKDASAARTAVGGCDIKGGGEGVEKIDVAKELL
ncbi:hypothetical protein KM043_006152 [Ampulex compressa]|nr:hypothetical protein KM043_006152 [Ampulex compressa]